MPNKPDDKGSDNTGSTDTGSTNTGSTDTSSTDSGSNGSCNTVAIPYDPPWTTQQEPETKEPEKGDNN